MYSFILQISPRVTFAVVCGVAKQFHISFLTHWGRVTQICVSKLTIIASDNGLSPGRRQAIIWNSAGILLIGRLGTHFSEILIEIITFAFKKMHLKVSSAKWRPFCLGLNMLKGNLHISPDFFCGITFSRLIKAMWSKNNSTDIMEMPGVFNCPRAFVEL